MNARVPRRNVLLEHTKVSKLKLKIDGTHIFKTNVFSSYYEGKIISAKSLMQTGLLFTNSLHIKNLLSVFYVTGLMQSSGETGM